MPEASQRYVLFASANAEQGQAVSGVVSELQLDSLVLVSVEELLFHTRGSVPEALVVEHELVSQVAQLDLITLLRRRKPLAEMPIVYLGPADPSVQATALDAGADVYLTSPPHPPVLVATLRRLLRRRQSDVALRATLERLREFERAYRDSERVKDDLTHMLVHDLKSPIASVMGLLDHSLEMVRSDERSDTVAQLLGLARTEAQHLLNLAANILDVRRMKEGHMPYQPDRIDDLTELARKALSDASGSPRERHFSVLVRKDAQILYADPALLRRILTNLFANAIKHTRAGGYVDFRAWRQDESFVLSVRDDGEGIPEADHKRIFNAFEQSRHTIHDRYDTGMGLTFCKLAVEKHGGSIWVESKVGRGSTFLFTIPVAVSTGPADDATLGVV
ncbi:MAG: hybrid sensor histidine kinase/response regulator [Trueperaceae bacterium]